MPAWISNYAHYNVWNEITYPYLNFNSANVWDEITHQFLNFNGATDEV